jgi:hypothetical protein
MKIKPKYKLGRIRGKAQRHFGYMISIPERTLRSTGALAGGLVKELTDVVLPGSFRKTKLYRSLVDTTLRFVIEEVGRAKSKPIDDSALPSDFALRRSTGNGIEVLGILLFRFSPVWVLAALSDLSSTSRVIIREVALTLQENNLLERGIEFENVDQILDGLERTSGRLADSFNTPPIDIEGLRDEWEAVKKEVSRIPVSQLPKPAKLFTVWNQLKQEANRQGCSSFHISSLMALSVVKRFPSRALWLSQCITLAATKTGRLFGHRLFEDYSSSLMEIRKAGYLRYWVNEFSPYLRAAGDHFSPHQTSYTQRLIAWCFENAGAVRKRSLRK